MTATLERADVVDATVAVADPCQEREIDRTRPPCPDPADWVATFSLAGVFADVAPREFTLCSGHAQERARHLADCLHCGRLARVALEPIDRTGR